MKTCKQGNNFRLQIKLSKAMPRICCSHTKIQFLPSKKNVDTAQRLGVVPEDKLKADLK